MSCYVLTQVFEVIAIKIKMVPQISVYMLDTIILGHILTFYGYNFKCLWSYINFLSHLMSMLGLEI